MPKVDFSYAFATPHRLTVALPDSSHKTLLDVHPEYMRMSWSYDSLQNKPLAAFTAPKTEWEILLKPELDGQPFPHSRWTRLEGWLPILENTYEKDRMRMRIEAAGGASAAIVRVEVLNQDDAPH